MSEVAEDTAYWKAKAEDYEKALREILNICKDRAAFVAQGPRGFIMAEAIAKDALKGRG